MRDLLSKKKLDIIRMAGRDIIHDSSTEVQASDAL